MYMIGSSFRRESEILFVGVCYVAGVGVIPFMD